MPKGAEFIDIDHSLMAAYIQRFDLRRAPELPPYDQVVDLRTIVGAPLGAPHGHCLFAGEHLATEYGGTMEGALRPGHEAARMLLSQLARG